MSHLIVLIGTTMDSVEVHRRTLKGGGIFNLFDWNSTSRKKLLSDFNEPGMTENSSLSEISSGPMQL